MASTVFLLAGCERAALEWRCPDLGAGDLVVSEVRGPQGGGADSWGEWIELYNSTATAIDLEGLEVSLTRLDGSGRVRILVRAPAVSAPAGGYVVLGRFAAGAEPTHVDYGYQVDLDTGMYGGGLIEVAACAELVDRAVYRDLPEAGSLGVDGAAAPDAAGNDDEAAWCVDDDPGDSPTAIGLPGTPGARNRPCA